MKYLNEIRLVQFKNYLNHQFHFDHNLIAIIGKNGTGKTNLLDAIYYLCFTKSYFQSKESFNIMQGKDGLRLQGVFGLQEQNEKEEIVCVIKESKKSILKDGIVYEKLSQHIGQYCAVMIAPDDIKIINEGGEFRRKFFDGFITQMQPEYLDSLLQYQKILAQKNAYLKQTPNFQLSSSLLKVYNEQLVPLGEILVKERAKITQEIKAAVLEFYHLLSGATESIDIFYQANVKAGEWEKTLNQVLDKEMEYKRVMIGAHLDDWEFRLSDFSFKTQASQGQKKSLLIALKLAQVKTLSEAGKTPLLLLDDIFEKLDRNRIEALFTLLKELRLPQIFLTHTYQQDIETQLQPIFENIQFVLL